MSERSVLSREGAPFGAAPTAKEASGDGRAKTGGLFAHPARLLHAALLATALVVFAWPIALPSGMVCGAALAAWGTLLAERLDRARYRLGAILGLSALVLVLGKLVVITFARAEWLAELVSPEVAIVIGELARWGAVGLGAAVALRALALRYRAALAIEGGVVVLAVATTVAAHRDGMIARPLNISDWFWAQGVDPVIAFLAIGVAGALLLAGVLAYGRSPRRTIAQLAFVLFLGLFLALFIHGNDLDTPKKNPSGKELNAKEDEKSKGDKNNSGGGGQGGDGSKSPFKDDLPKGGESRQNHPAAIVVFHKDVTPGGGVFYFRHAVFSQFNGTRLVEATRPDVDPDAVRSFPVARQDVPGPAPDTAGRTLVATDVALLSEHNRLFALTDAVEVAPMPNPEPARFRRAYRVVSSVVTDDYQSLLGAKPGDPKWSDEVWDHYTELPKDERYHQLADQLRGQIKSEYAKDPMALALTVKRYLEENATYSFARNYEGEEDPTGAFLFSEDKRGYCVHLAHAATYLLRAMGVPARVSAGYGVPAQNLGGGSSLLIKSGDAHAWAEIYLQDVGWVPIEVTPEKTDVKPQRFEEKDLQQLLGEMARKEGRESREASEPPRVLAAIKAFLQLVPYLVAALIALAYALKVWRLLAPVLVPAKQRPRVAYRAALDRLSAIGLLRARGEPRERFARRVKGTTPSFEPLTATHVGVAFGSQDALRSLASREPPQLAALASRVGREVRGAVPWWRWVIGLLNPVSWMWSR